MENKVKSESTISATISANKESAPTRLRVYRKKSTYKGATDTDFWYSATRSDSASIICKFKCPVLTDSVAFEISNVTGNPKHCPTTDDDGNIIFDNYIYYINSCDFHEIEGEKLKL